MYHNNKNKSSLKILLEHFRFFFTFALVNLNISSTFLASSIFIYEVNIVISIYFLTKILKTFF